MIASLRARLLVAVLALTAVGMLLLGGITYAEQRSFLMERLDEQTLQAPEFVARQLAFHQRGEVRRGPGPPGGGGGPAVGLPAGIYGEWRESDGTVERITIGLDQASQEGPDLPDALPLGQLVTVPGKGGDSSYRVIAQRERFGEGVVVAAVSLREVDQTLQRLLAVEALVLAAVLFGLGAVAWAVVRVGLLPLDRIGHTAGAIAGGDLSRRVTPTDPRTEVGRLGIALNAMLDRLERAFAERQASEDRLRRFLADASHELRTPLASIRGYAELFRMGAASEPEDVKRSMARIEDEATRMGVLVEDLLTLARLDQVPDVPHVEVDLAEIARDAVDDARATAPDRPIGLETVPPALTTGDPHQLRQVLANLLRNALVHTPAGTPVEVTVDGSRGGVRVEVRDHGPGLPTDAPETLFERFWRAEGGRERGRAGAGLGLAIVAAIVDAHN
ncbi:MAG TPA: HAMP domain-containing sensor histidine kinase, partial [Solirubrobacteraceae bacterium]|nr:HAMP domain-containing sensor histidine kinase [Solirubrobacteraceae bacterium]